VAESPTYFRSSEISLDGEPAPRHSATASDAYSARSVSAPPDHAPATETAARPCDPSASRLA
jgi:hypothetical protein